MFKYKFSLSYLRNKSGFNFDSAALLIEEDKFAPSVHCSYYSVFQLMKYLYVQIKKISYENLNQNIITDKRNTHKYLIDEFCLHLQSDTSCKLNTFEVRELKNDIKDLKQFRLESDYDDIEINYKKSTQALSLSESILKRLKNIL